jgi:hypothetical protein
MQAWLLCAVLLAGGSGRAQPPASSALGTGTLVLGTTPVPPPTPMPLAPDSPTEETDAAPEELTEEAAPADEAHPEEDAAVKEDDSTSEELDEEPVRAGYADTTGNLENLEDLDGLRVSVRTGALRARRGYTPLEVTLHNTENVPQPVRLSFQGYSSGSSTAERVVELAPRQRLTTHLLVPAPVQSGLFTVNGPNLRPRQTGVYLDEGSALSALVLGPSKAFEAGTGIPRAEDSKPPEVNVRFVPVQDAPRELAAYVGFHVVAVTEEVASVPADVWAALENYAAAGGSLLVARVPRDVPQRLPLLHPEPQRDAWNAYGFGHVYLCQSGVQDCGRAMLAVNEASKPPLDPIGPPPRWETSRYALAGGETPLLPNALVPLGRFLVFIFLFSLVVGPGGLILARRKGPAALLIGVPAVALVTCLIIVGNSLLVDGFVTHASRYSYTWLDRPRDRAVTAVVAGYYANLPAGTVRLPSNSVLIAPAEVDDWLVDVNWTGGGMEADGFLPARTYVEWGELAVVPTRARLVARPEGPAVRVQNALGAPLKAGYLRLGKKTYWLPEIADGAEGVATEQGAASGTSKDPQVALIEAIVNPPVHVKRRGAHVGGGFMQPLEEGGFVAQLGGQGFGPLAGMDVELHEGIHYVRGRVDTP